MDRFNHSDNIIMNRRDLFATLQDMIYSGFNKWINGIYKYEFYKLICGNSEIGIIGDSDFRVDATPGMTTISVNAGVGTGGDNTSLIYNRSTQDITISSLPNGMHYVYAVYKQDKSLTGKELPLPPKGYINTDTMYTVLQDSCEIFISTNPNLSGGILLAGIGIHGGAIAPSVAGVISSNIYTSDTGIAFPMSTPPPRLTWATQLSAANRQVMKVGNEYIGVDTAWAITERGKHRTVVENHNAGDAYTMLSVIDYRQERLLTMKGQDPGNSMLDSGMMYIGGELRTVATRNIVAPPLAPSIGLSSAPLWVNRSSATGLMTTNIVAIYSRLNTTILNIANIRAQIDGINTQMLGLDDDDQGILTYQAELSRYHSELVRLLAQQQAQMATLSNSEVRAYQNAGTDMFELVVHISPASVSEKVVQYEMQVSRSAIASSADSYSVYAETIYSLRLYPTGYTDSGDPIYDTSDRRINQIRVPVRIGERVAIKVRGISENNIYGGYSPETVYEFSNFADAEYVTYKNIYNMLAPDLVYGYQALQEALSYVQESQNRNKEISNTIDGLLKDVQSVRTLARGNQDNITQLWALRSLIPYIGKIISISTGEVPPLPGAAAPLPVDNNYIFKDQQGVNL